MSLVANIFFHCVLSHLSITLVSGCQSVFFSPFFLTSFLSSFLPHFLTSCLISFLLPSFLTSSILPSYLPSFLSILDTLYCYSSYYIFFINLVLKLHRYEKLQRNLNDLEIRNQELSNTIKSNSEPPTSAPYKNEVYS